MTNGRFYQVCVFLLNGGLLASCGGGGGSNEPAGTVVADSSGSSSIPETPLTTPLQAPLLVDAQAQIYLINSAISRLPFSNSGGGELLSCSADALPAGLSVDISSDASYCEVSGTPTVIQSVSRSNITATNASGSDTASVNITVTDGNCTGSMPGINLNGRVTFDRVPLLNTGGLDFSSVSQQPVREAVIEVICNGRILLSSRTDQNGEYSFALPSDINGIFLRVKAQMQSTGTPSWDVEVIDESQISRLVFSMDGSTFDTASSNIVRDLNAASGWGGNSYTAARAAAPFAIMDTVYSAMQLVLNESSNIHFPPLELRWSANSTNGTYYFENTISVLGRTSDSDEFDEHVIAHEWGHYFQDAFSRDDSLGGAHSSDDILDIRVAFSEGFGNAFSAMVTGDPLYKDSQSVSSSTGFTFNVESNNCANEGWFSECSVQSILYDLFDSANDDTFNLGFSGIYSVLTLDMPTTEAHTSLFSFIRPYKSKPGVNAGELDSLLAIQSIDSIVDDIGSGMTLSPGTTDQLPVYNVSAFPFTLCLTGENGGYNGLGVSRFAQFVAPSSGDFTFSATRTTGMQTSDPDIYLSSSGLLVAVGESLVNNSETMVANLLSGRVYVLELTEFSSYGDSAYNPTAPGAVNETCYTVNRI